MLASSFSVLLPVLFVIARCYFAGRAKEFDTDQVKGINELVLDFALPAIMFVGIVRTASNPPAGETAFLVAITFALVAFYIAVLLVSLTVLRHSLGEAALQARPRSGCRPKARPTPRCRRPKARAASPLLFPQSRYRRGRRRRSVSRRGRDR
jgi:hypothetical protein